MGVVYFSIIPTFEPSRYCKCWIVCFYNKIDVLTEEIKKKENETIKTVIETFNAQKPEPESLETEMMKILMPELIKNPNAADVLLRLSEKFK